MLPESETGDTARGESLARSARRRGQARSRPGGGEAEQPVVRIMQLVAALKAEHDTLGPPTAPDATDERVRMMSSLRRILDTREQERQAWEEQIRGLEARFAAAEAAARAAQSTAAEADAQHQRLVGDLKLMHEHQRSIWQLERRRLEITIEGLEQAQRSTLVRRAARLARPALALGLLLVSLAALALSADSVSLSHRLMIDLDDTSHAVLAAQR